jgi:1-acyl-sn-glycerol-3-phosphate acyltransferase
MLRWLRSAFWTVARLILSLRYRVRVHGLEEARLKGPVLIVPNHPGYIDPPSSFPPSGQLCGRVP